MSALPFSVSLNRNDRCLEHLVAVDVDVRVDKNVAEEFSKEDTSLEQDHGSHQWCESFSFEALVLIEDALESL